MDGMTKMKMYMGVSTTCIQDVLMRMFMFKPKIMWNELCDKGRYDGSL